MGPLELHSSAEWLSSQWTTNVVSSTGAAISVVALAVSALIAHTRITTCKRYIEDDRVRTLVYRRAARVHRGLIPHEIAFDYTEDTIGALKTKKPQLVLRWLLPERLRRTYDRAERNSIRAAYDYLSAVQYNGLDHPVTITPHQDIKEYSRGNILTQSFPTFPTQDNTLDDTVQEDD